MKQWVMDLRSVSSRVQWKSLATNAAIATGGATVVCWWLETPSLVGALGVVAGVAAAAGVFWRDWIRPVEGNVDE